MRKWIVRDIKEYELDAPDEMGEEEVKEAYNFGDLEGTEIEGHIEVEPEQTNDANKTGD